MNEFAKKLTYVIGKYCSSIQSAAKRLNIERPNLYKYMCGSRLPTSIDFVEKLANVLMMSTVERDELIELYKIEKMGDSVYRRRIIIRDVLINASKTDFVKTSPIINHYAHDFVNTKDCFPVYGINNVKNMIRCLIEMESSKDNSHLQIVAPPTSEFLIGVLQSALFETKVKVEHIFCLEKTVRDDHENLYNIECFKSIFPLLYFSNSYTPMYYYDTIATQMNLMQYLIVLSDGGIGFSADYQFAVIYRSEEYLSFMNKLVDNVKKSTNNMVRPLNSPIDHAKLYSNNYEIGNHLVNILEPEPCFGAFFTDILINKKILPEIPLRKEIVSAATQMYSLHKVQSKSKNPPCTIFSNEGLDIFVKTGRIAEIPADIYEPFTVSERIELLEKLYDSMNDKIPTAIMIDINKLRLPNNLIISTYLDQSVQIVLIKQDSPPIYIVVNESSINFTICDYLSYLANSNYAFSKSDALDIIALRIFELKKLLINASDSLQLIQPNSISTTSIKATKKATRVKSTKKTSRVKSTDNETRV